MFEQNVGSMKNEVMFTYLTLTEPAQRTDNA